MSNGARHPRHGNLSKRFGCESHVGKNNARRIFNDEWVSSCFSFATTDTRKCVFEIGIRVRELQLNAPELNAVDAIHIL